MTITISFDMIIYFFAIIGAIYSGYKFLELFNKALIYFLTGTWQR